jgi:hypothetical protein
MGKVGPQIERKLTREMRTQEIAILATKIPTHAENAPNERPDRLGIGVLRLRCEGSTE